MDQTSERPVAQAAERLARMAGINLDPAAPRRGPRPLGLHLAAALTMWLGLPTAWPSLKSGLPGLSPELAQRFDRIRHRLGPQKKGEFEKALAAAAVDRARIFVGGIKTYRHHRAHRSLRAAPVIWKRGSTVLRDYNPGAPDARPVLVIPSLINRFDILDLDKDHSFLRTLAEHKMRPLLVDWDRPGADEKDFALSDYVTERLLPILDFLRAGNEPINALGYCMGGNLALGLAALRPQQIRTLILLATPWDFHKPDAAIGPHFVDLAGQMEPYLQTLGFLPVDIIQTLFAGFQPAQVMAKFTEFAALDPAGTEARHFVLLEDWLNDGVPLTAPVARDCLRGWYGENLTAKLGWKIGGTIVDPRNFTMPSYVVVPGKDRIVPPESAMPLTKLLPHCSLHGPMAGHIGMIASQKAPRQVWAPLISWLEKHV